MINTQTITGRLVQGHQVASGRNGDPRFPGGTVRMQTPHFLARGFDINCFFPGTLNVSIAPFRYRVLKARYAFTQVKWHPTEPAEDFSFFDVALKFPDRADIAGFVYYPHPETKPAHFQKPDVLEILVPYIEGLHYGDSVRIELPAEQIIIRSPDPNVEIA